MYYGKQQARDEVAVNPQMPLSFKLEDAKGRKGVTLNASEH